MFGKFKKVGASHHENRSHDFLSNYLKCIVLICGVIVFLKTPASTVTIQDQFELLEQANEYYSKGEWNKAIILYKKAEARGAPLSITGFNLGNCYFRMGNFSKAIAAYRKSIHSSTTPPLAALLNISNLYYRIGEYGSSIAGYRRLLKYEPENTSAWLYLADAYQQSGDFVGAQNALEKVLALDSNQTSAVYMLSELYAKLQEYDRSISLVEKAYRDNPEEIDFLFYLGDISRDAQNYEKAAEYYRSGLTFQPTKTEVMYKLADVLERSGQTYLAMDVLNQILNLDSEYTDAAIFLGNLAYNQKWTSRALDAYLRAIKKKNEEGLDGVKNIFYDFLDKNQIDEAKKVLQNLKEVMQPQSKRFSELKELQQQLVESEKAKLGN